CARSLGLYAMDYW
nr:immunoglobulin heavy chain junction region [Mus musculus]